MFGNEESIIGFVYRFGCNDYQISLMEFSEEDQNTLMEMFTRYEDCTGVRGDKTLTIEDANVDYFERA